MAVEAGAMFVRLFGRDDDAAFKRWNRNVDKAEQKARVANIKADLDGEFHDKDFELYQRAQAKAEARAKRREAFKTHLGGDYDGRAFQQYERALARADRANHSTARSSGVLGKALDGLTPKLDFSTRVPVAKILALGGAFAYVTPLALGLIGPLGQVGSMIGALPGLAGAGAQGILSGFLGLKGIGEATTTAWDAQTTAAKDASAAADRNAGAVEAVKSAHEQLTDAEEDAERAQRDLNDANQQAARDYEDLRLAATRSSLQQTSAARRVKEARAELLDLKVDPDATGPEIAKAREDLKVAEFDLQEARIQRSRARQDARKAEQEGGAAGMPAAVDARERLADANKAVQRSTEGLRQAQADAVQTMGETSGGVDKLAEDMSKLSPAGQRFVRFLQAEWFPKVKELRATAQGGLLPGLEDGARKAEAVFPVLNRGIGDTSRELGELARRGGEMVSSKGWLADLETLGDRNTKSVGRFGQAGLNVADALRHLMIAAYPLQDFLERTVLGWSKSAEEQAKAGRESGRMERFFRRTADTLDTLFNITGNVAGGLFNVGKAGSDSGKETLESIEDVTERFEEWSGSMEGQNTLRGWFEASQEAREEVYDYFGGLIDRFKELRGEGKSVGDAITTVMGEQLGEATELAAKQVGQHAPDIAAGFVNGFLAANVWGKLLLGGWLLKKLGAGAATGAIMNRLGGGLADDFAGAISTRLKTRGGRVTDGIRGLFGRGRAAAGAATTAATETATSYVGSVTSTIRRRASRVRDAVRSMLASRATTSAAGSAGSAVGGEAAGGIAAAMRRRAGSIRTLLRRVLLGGAAAGGAAEAGGAALGGEAVGGLSGRIRNGAGRVRNAIQRALGGRAMSTVASGAGSAIGSDVVHGAGSRVERESTRRGRLGKAMSRAGKVAGIAFAAAAAIAIGLEIGEQLQKNKQWREFTDKLLGRRSAENDPMFKLDKSQGTGDFWKIPKQPQRPESQRKPIGGAMGGLVSALGIQRFDVGGLVRSLIPPGEDTLAGLKFGEFVQRRETVQREGVSNMRALNEGRATITPKGGLAGTLEGDRRKATGPLKATGRDLDSFATMARRAGTRAGKGISDPLEKATKETTKDTRKFRKNVGDEHGDLGRDLDKTTKRTTTRLLDRYDDLTRGVTRRTTRLARLASGDLSGLGRTYDRITGRMVDRTNNRFESMRRTGARESRRFASSVTASMRTTDNAVYKGLGYITSATNSALKAFDAKPIKLSVDKPKGFATGGMLQLGTPGQRGQDSIPMRHRGRDIVAAPGEVLAFLTGDQQRELDARTSDVGGLKGFFSRFNTPHAQTRGYQLGGGAGSGTAQFARGGIAEDEVDARTRGRTKRRREQVSTIQQMRSHPVLRFAAGGMVRVPGDPDDTGGRDKVNPAIVDQVASYIKRFGIKIGYAYDPGHHSSPGHNVTGTALDIHPHTTGWDGVDRAAAAAVKAGKTVYYDGRFGTTNLPPHGRGHHLHVEWGGGGAIKGSAKGLGIADAPAWKSIKRLLVEGTDGPPKDIAQKALDKARRAANTYGVDQAGEGAVGGGAGAGAYKGPLNRTFPRGSNQTISFNQAAMLAEKAGLPGVTYAQIAQGESTLRPGADGGLAGTPGPPGYGLWQMTPAVQNASTVRRWEAIGSYFNPWNNARMAKVLAGSGNGLSNYYGTGFVKGGVQHYKGDLKDVDERQGGGIVGQLVAMARGGLIGGDGASIAQYFDRGGAINWGTGTGAPNEWTAGPKGSAGSMLLGKTNTPEAASDRTRAKAPVKYRGRAIRLPSPKKLGLKKFSKHVAKLTNGGRERIKPIEAELEGIDDRYTRAERLYNLDDEAIVLNPGDRGYDPKRALAAGVKKDEKGNPDGPYLDEQALAERLGELDQLLKIRLRAVQLWDKYLQAVAKIRAQVEAANKRLRTYRERLRGQLRRVPKGKRYDKERKKLKKAVDGVSDQIDDNHGLWSRWGKKVPGLVSSRGDSWLEYQELLKERNALAPDARWEVAQGNIAEDDGESAEDVAAEAYRQFQEFQAQRAELFRNFGSNFVNPARLSQAFADPSQQAAGLAFWGAFENNFGAGGGGLTINQDIRFAGGATDERLFPHIAAHEARAAAGLPG